jgi:hypothetical protein
MCVPNRYLLPPIIFYAGLSVKKKQFFRNFATIASFGIFGTYIAFALIALVLYGLAQLPNVLDLSVGRLLAPSHPVAVLAKGTVGPIPSTCQYLHVRINRHSWINPMSYSTHALPIQLPNLVMFKHACITCFPASDLHQEVCQ